MWILLYTRVSNPSNSADTDQAARIAFTHCFIMPFKLTPLQKLHLHNYKIYIYTLTKFTYTPLQILHLHNYLIYIYSFVNITLTHLLN